MTTRSGEDIIKAAEENLTPEEFEAFKTKMIRSALITKFLFANEPIDQKDALMGVLMTSSDLTVKSILAFVMDAMESITEGISTDSDDDPKDNSWLNDDPEA